MLEVQHHQTDQRYFQNQPARPVFEPTQIQFCHTMPDLIEPDKMNCIIPPTEELGGVYLGNLQGALDVELLQEYKIRAVLTTSVETGLKYSDQIIQYHLSVGAMDILEYDMSQHYDECFDFIEKHRKHTNVFVHCFAGVSRSASIVLIYLMRKFNWPIEKALWFVKQKRKLVYPNPSFMKQLKQYEKEYFAKLATQQKPVQQTQVPPQQQLVQHQQQQQFVQQQPNPLVQQQQYFSSQQTQQQQQAPLPLVQQQIQQSPQTQSHQQQQQLPLQQPVTFQKQPQTMPKEVVEQQTTAQLQAQVVGLQQQPPVQKMQQPQQMQQQQQKQQQPQQQQQKVQAPLTPQQQQQMMYHQQQQQLMMQQQQFTHGGMPVDKTLPKQQPYQQQNLRTGPNNQYLKQFQIHRK